MSRSIHNTVALLAATLAHLVCQSQALADRPKPLSDKHVEVLRRIHGGFPIDGREKRLPHEGFIADERSWGVLWQALDNKLLPKVDFERELVLFAILSDENELTLHSIMEDGGNVNALGMATLVDYENPRFGSYDMHVVRREGISTVNGKPVRKGIWRQVNPASRGK